MKEGVLGAAIRNRGLRTVFKRRRKGLGSLGHCDNGGRAVTAGGFCLDYLCGPQAASH